MVTLENRLENQKQKPDFDFKNLVEAEEYLEWKKAVSVSFRRQVEAVIKGNEPLPNQTGLVLNDQFLETLGKILTQNKEVDLSEIDSRVSNLLSPLERIETKGGYLNVFETLRNPDASWNLKRKIYETQIKPALDWLVEKDLEKIAEEEKQTMERNQVPDERQPGPKKNESLPPESENARSSMEAQSEKKEGEPNAIFSVKPFYGGYFKQAAYRRLNPRTFEWEKDAPEVEELERQNPNAAETKILSGRIRGNQAVALPLPYDWAVDPDSFETDAPRENVKIFRNQNGDWHLQIADEGFFQYQLRIAPRQSVEIGRKFSESETNIGGDLHEELQKKIAELKKENLPKMKLAREIAKYIRGSLVYSSGSSESVAAWKHYTENPDEFFQRIWEQKKADCFVANTLATRAMAEAGIKARFVGGYFVKEKSKNGAAVMHAGNGHGWLEVWDEFSRQPVRLDATPKGDPNLDDQQQEKDLDSETGEGDFGESEDELMSEEELKRKIEKMRDQKEKKDQKRATTSDLEEARFAELAECTPEQAREFLNALERVRQFKDGGGNPISDLLKDEWKKIITERKIEINDYRGPVRMDEGDNLEDPVSARIDILSKEFNPTGFEKLEREEKIETEFGGINIYFSFDLSGSMKEPDAASGRRKADVQRDVALLFADSLMQCAYVSRREGQNPDLLPIKIMVTLASDRGEVKLHLTDKWGPKEQWAYYAALNQLAKGGTPTHTTLELIEKDFDQEIADLKKKKIPKEKLPIHYCAEISDGAPDDFDETEAMHVKLKEKSMAIRSYCIGERSASADAADPIDSFSQLPGILSKDIIDKFKKLNPKRIRQ